MLGWGIKAIEKEKQKRKKPSLPLLVRKKNVGE